MGTRTLFSRLSNIQLLLLDADRRISKLVREVLWNIGFQKVQIAHDGSEGLKIMRKTPIDLVITEWKMDPVDGISFIKYLRSAPDSPNRYVPIIMLTANIEKDDVQAARDIGITELVVKPFNSRTLFDRIVLVVENPRPFIMAKGFKGPDRRRREAPADGEERRKRRSLVNTGGADYVPVVPPDYALKKKIGEDVDIRELLEPDVIEQSEAVIATHRTDFVEWVKKDVAAIELLYQAILRSPATANASRAKLEELAFSVNAQSGTFGYGLASQVAKSLFDFTKHHFNPTEDHLRVMQKHVESLYAIFDTNIKGDGGVVGVEMLDTLEKLKKKFVAN